MTTKQLGEEVTKNGRSSLQHIVDDLKLYFKEKGREEIEADWNQFAHLDENNDFPKFIDYISIVKENKLNDIQKEEIEELNYSFNEMLKKSKSPYKDKIEYTQVTLKDEPMYAKWERELIISINDNKL